MNKQQKIIVSIVGISIVLLALLGLTYAYYLTRIEGNTNTNSISITTADLKLVYGDGNGLVTKENIMPGTTIEKTFTVTNSGNNKVDLYAVYLEELTNTLSRTEDLTYVLTCESTGEDCDGNDGEFPTLAGMIVTNSIDTGVTHTYTLTVTYKNEENIDQSIDMGSTISAFVQIYALKDIVDIEGSVNGTEDGDFAQINSVQKRSQIVDGKYKFAGVLPGTHTIKICSKSDANCTSPKLTKQIIINLGNAAGVDGNKITITNDSQTATIDIDLSETIESNKVIIGTTIKKYNPFKNGTLAYDIIDNAMRVSDNTMNEGIAKLSQYKTIPGKTASGGYKIFETEKLTTTLTTYQQNPTSSDSYVYVYSDEYILDVNTGFELVNPKTGTYSAIANNLEGKYVAYYYPAYKNFIKTTEKMSIYQITNAPSPSTTSSIEVEYIRLEAKAGAFDEAIITTTEDDYGISYYYRGNVLNNYLNYSGMCWRIVRIDGNGNIKIVLADAYNECNNGSYSIDDVNSALLDIQIGNYNHFDFNQAKNWVTNNLTNTSLLIEAEWCIDESIKEKIYVDNGTLEFDYDDDGITDEFFPEYEETITYTSWSRLNPKTAKPTLKCNMTGIDDSKARIKKSIVGTLTADEVVFAGAVYNNDTLDVAKQDYYLITNAEESFYEGSNYDLEFTSYLTLTPMEYYYNENYNYSYSYIGDWYARTNGTVDSDYDGRGVSSAMRPAVVLKSGIVATTNSESIYAAGTYQNPYVIN